MVILLTRLAHLLACLNTDHDFPSSGWINDGLDLSLRNESLIRHTVPAMMLLLVDILPLLQHLPSIPHRLLVRLIRGANEYVITDVNTSGQFPEHIGASVAERLRIYLRFGSGLLDFDAVFIGAGAEHCSALFQALPPRDNVCEDHSVHVSDMRSGIDVEDGSSRVEGFVGIIRDRCCCQFAAPDLLLLASVARPLRWSSSRYEGLERCEGGREMRQTRAHCSFGTFTLALQLPYMSLVAQALPVLSSFGYWMYQWLSS